MRDLSDDTETDAIVTHMRDCESCDCALCVYDDLDQYEQTQHLLRFDHDDARELQRT